jgi:hypothetical protein
VSLRRHPVSAPRSEEEAMYQAVVITKPIVPALVVAGRMRVAFVG